MDFHNLFESHMIESYKWDLWGVCYVIAEGCSDDAFEDFRSWLISMGRNVFEEAITNAESLTVSAYRPEIEDIFFEEFQYVSSDIYEKITGHEIPPSYVAYPDSPSGKKWTENELEHRFPKIWQKHHDFNQGTK